MKPMVATVVARLAKAGRLSLDDPVEAHVPELRGATWAARATLRDLLANRSGVPLRRALEFGFAAHADDDDGVLARFAAEVAEEESTSTAWSYTNAGWCVLGRAIETATGMVWEEAMRSELLEPAGMRGTSFAAEPESAARVSGHELTADGAVPVTPLVARAYGPAGTTMVSTIGDLLRFAALHLEDPTLALLRRPQPAPAIRGWFDGWCLGWALFDWEERRVWGWDGVVSGERAILRLLPERHAAVVLLTNGDNGRALYRTLLPELTYSRFGLGVPPLNLDAHISAAGDLSRFAGLYGWPDRRVEVTVAESGLVITSDHGEVEALPLDERAFVLDQADPDNPTVTFATFDGAGRPQVLYVMLWALPRIDG
jgi:CubicO group peptidase (beta-lactamase class C family)